MMGAILSRVLRKGSSKTKTTYNTPVLNPPASLWYTGKVNEIGGTIEVLWLEAPYVITKGLKSCFILNDCVLFAGVGEINIG